ncbi:Cuticle protein LPCP-23 [Habropoda laboriosa]|uniref:Cuticle protein LPCP-23 n=1 Tax=Habropoda laboriosa TaxID=597456 RepID=A0A0L7RHF6_9HYME|nr:Cuticle protein LPCP-23 [Habropoda laboriosa]
MQNNPGNSRPFKPIWGSEVTMLTNDELINENIYDFSSDDSHDQHFNYDTSTSSNHFTPTEEYLQMTERLIESNALSPRTSTILKDLYDRYKSINKYGPEISDPNIKRHHTGKDFSKSIKSHGGHKETNKPQTSARSKKHTAFGCVISRLGEKEKPLKSETSPIDPRESDNFHQDIGSSSYILQTIADSTFYQPCDAEAIKIDNIFSDFFLNTRSLDKSSRMRSRLWLVKEKQSNTNIPSTSNKNTNDKLLAALLAVVSAGGPAVYDIAASSGDHSSIGFSQESTQKGLGGQNVISSYSKSDDSAHSFVRVSSHSVSNDGLLKYDIAHAPLVKTAYTAPSYLAPTATPLIAKTYAAPYSYSAPLLTKTYDAAPSYTYGAPLLTKAYAAPTPLIAKAAVAAPAPLLAKAYASPIAAAPLYAKSYSTPLLSAAPAPLLAKTYEYAAHAPVIAKKPQLITKAYGYEAASPDVHTVFNGLGTSYSW